jgi:hypothetical protein
MTKKWNPRPEVIRHLKKFYGKEAGSCVFVSDGSFFKPEGLLSAVKSGTNFGREVYIVAERIYDVMCSNDKRAKLEYIGEVMTRPFKMLKDKNENPEVYSRYSLREVRQADIEIMLVQILWKNQKLGKREEK